MALIEAFVDIFWLPEVIDLWLDDERSMPEGYNQRATDYHWAKAVLEVCMGERDMWTGPLPYRPILRSISFDHDLGHDRPDRTGYEIACIIEAAAAKGQLPRVDWKVHSMNPVGAARIRTAMENADRYWSKHDGRHNPTG